MSGYPRDYYPYTGARSSDRSLPPIRDVVGDELASGRPVSSHPSSYPHHDTRYSSSPSTRHDQRGLTLPPIHHPGTLSGSTGHHTSHYSSRPHGQAYSGDPRAIPSGLPAASSYRSRTPAPMSNSSMGPAIPASGSRSTYPDTNALDDEPEKRHKCDYCGKKFDRPSSLQVHVRTHTGDQPFVCDWPGCSRTFNVKSNMLRHLRSHERHEVNPYPSQASGDPNEEDYATDYYAPNKASHSSSAAAYSSASHYTSSSYRR